MSDVFRLRFRPTEDIERRLNTAVLAAQIHSAADQLEAVYRQIEPALDELHRAPGRVTAPGRAE